MSAEDALGPCTPFLIAANVPASLTHYVDGLGFALRAATPAEEPFFAIVARGEAQIMLKSVEAARRPLPNRLIHEWAPWDVFVFAPDPAALAQEFADRGVALEEEPARRDDGLFGFAVADPDGYVCFFGTPA